MSFSIRVIAFVSTALLMSACDKGSKSSFQNPANRAESDIHRSFSISQEKGEPNAVDRSVLQVDRAKITIEKSALEKEFLLQSSMVSQVFIPSFKGQKSRIVFFRQIENKIYMIEASQGLKLAKDYPTTLLLAEFDILAENEKAVTFDFNQGMSRLFLAGDWYARDFSGVYPNVNYQSAKAAFSYIEHAGFANNQLLEITQRAQVEINRPTGLKANIPVKAVYYLSPYAPSETFVPQRAPATYDRVGFFEAAPVINEQGGPTSFVAKMDITKPVVYAVSANTPENFKQAVRDGVLYWNKAFGKEIVQVMDAPKDVYAPHPLYNVIQWVDFDAAGFAYADAQVDPRTGEVLHQQVYFTSAFAQVGRAHTRRFLRKQTNETKLDFGLAGFQNEDLCNLDFSKLIEQASASLRDEKDAAKVAKATADLIREVVAHEVGHTLGLRHNFAGSLAGNYDLDQREHLFREYLNSGSAKPDIVPSSSVMDYQQNIEGMMAGDHIAKLDHAAEYDTKAIETLYLGKKYASGDMPLFCTDSHIGDYQDCNVFDAGGSLVSWIKYQGHDFVHSLPNLLLERFITAKSPPYGAQPVEVNELELDPAYDAVLTLYQTEAFLKVLTPKSRLITIERQYPLVSEINRHEVRQKTLDLVTADLAKNGGFENVLINASSDSLAELEANFEKLLNDPDATAGIGANGKPYEFTASEIAQMKEISKSYFKRYREELAKAEAKLLTGKPVYEEAVDPSQPKTEEPKFDISRLSDEYASYLLKRAKTILTSTVGEPLVIKRSTGSEWSIPKNPGSNPGNATKTESTFTLPQFVYPLEVRKSVATVFRSDRAEKPNWGYVQKVTLQKTHKDFVDKAIPGILSDAKSDHGSSSTTYEEYPAEMISWTLEAAEIQKALN